RTLPPPRHRLTRFSGHWRFGRVLLAVLDLAADPDLIDHDIRQGVDRNLPRIRSEHDQVGQLSWGENAAVVEVARPGGVRTPRPATSPGGTEHASCCTRSAWTNGTRACGPGRCQAASGSASPSPARWPATRRCSSSTRPSPRLTY